ncbi:MAG TPA: hypothetical protein VGK74_29095 [Symbiobacteriaceae bacterium]
MLRNRFRMFTGVLVLLAFGVGVFAYIRQTRGNPYVGEAMSFGIKIVLFLAIILGVVYLIDRRVNQRPR